MTTDTDHNATIFVVDDEESLTDLVPSAKRVLDRRARSQAGSFDVTLDMGGRP